MNKRLKLWGAIVICGLIAFLGGYLYQTKSSDNPILSREGVLMQIKRLNRLESTAFYIDTIIRTEKKGDWRKLWQDSQSGLFVVRGKVLAGLDLDKLTVENVNIVDGKSIISLPAVEILSVDIENIEVYDVHTGAFNLYPMDKNMFSLMQEQAKKQILNSACKAEILQHAHQQAQSQLENLFAITQMKASVYSAAVPRCQL